MTTSESAAPIDVDKAKNLATGNSKLVVKTPKLVDTTKLIDIDDNELPHDNPRIKQSLRRVFPQGLDKVPQDQIQTAIKKELPRTRNRGIKQAGFHVLVGASMPNVLVEVGFLSNKDEAKKLSSSKYKEQISNAIYDSIIQFKEVYEQ